MTPFSDFVDSPTEEFLDNCTKEQLFEIGKQYGFELDGSKENVKAILVANLFEKGILQRPPVERDASKPVALPPGVTYEQHRELLLLLLQFEHEKFLLKAHLEAHLVGD